MAIDLSKLPELPPGYSWTWHRDLQTLAVVHRRSREFRSEAWWGSYTYKLRIRTSRTNNGKFFDTEGVNTLEEAVNIIVTTLQLGQYED